MRTARSRTSGENLFDFFMALSSQRKEPPQIPGRFKPLKIHTGPLRLGETVEAIGHPKGYEFTITRGVVSAMRRQRSANIGSDLPVEFVQTDTPISPGNSGGPLLLGNAVIGVNDWIRVDKGSQNLNFSVSFNEIREFLNRSQAK
jgi:S1-C subfamily serine protease